MADPDALSAVLDACAAGSVAPNIALMRLVMLAESEAEIDEALRQRERADDPVAEVTRLWSKASPAFRTLSAIHRLGTQPEDAVADWAAIFDSAAALDPHAAVALYSLGDPELLRRATDEIVQRLREWNLLNQTGTVLDFGCGTGRVSTAIAPFVQRVIAIDVSPKMVRLASVASAAHKNIEVRCSGNPASLSQQFDAILAVDSMPYVVQSGRAEQLWEQVASALKPGGFWAILNYSYRGDSRADGYEIAALARRFLFTVEREESGAFRFWDAQTYLLRKR